MTPENTEHFPREPDFEQTKVFRRNVVFEAGTVNTIARIFFEKSSGKLTQVNE
jgi:hypothetical protein